MLRSLFLQTHPPCSGLTKGHSPRLQSRRGARQNISRAVCVDSGVAGVVFGDDILQIAIAFLLAAFVVQRIAIGVHFVEPDVFGGRLGHLVLWPPDLGEQQNGGADPGIGFEHAAGQGDDGFEVAALDQQLAQGFEGAAGAEQHALRHDHAGGAAFFQQAVDVFDKQQLGFGGAQLQVFVDVALVDAAGKRRIGHDDVVLGFLGKALAEGVLVIDVRLVDAVHHQVHQPQAHHGASMS